MSIKWSATALLLNCLLEDMVAFSGCVFKADVGLKTLSGALTPTPPPYKFQLTTTLCEVEALQ